MAALNFPNSPSVNDIHTENGVSFKWNGTIWKKVGSTYTDTTNLNVTGIGTFAGAVNIGGVLTYEDVKNVDSVGIITARSGIDCNGTLEVSSTSNFDGSLQIADTILHLGDTNTKIRFPSADTISAETGGSERLRVTSTGQVKIGNDPTMDSNANLHVEDASGECGVWIEGNTGGAGAYLLLKNNSTSSNPKTYIGGVDAGGQGISQIEFHNLDNGTNEGAMSLHTRPASGSMTERLRIDSSGRLLIGLTAAVSLPYSTYGAIQTQGAYNTSSINIINNENSGNTSALTFNKIRASSAAGVSSGLAGIIRLTGTSKSVLWGFFLFADE